MIRGRVIETLSVKCKFTAITTQLTPLKIVKKQQQQQKKIFFLSFLAHNLAPSLKNVFLTKEHKKIFFLFKETGVYIEIFSSCTFQYSYLAMTFEVLLQRVN
jgi:hypothetical protein